MQLPDAVPVMILPNAILFPQAMVPLYIFEPRYRRMLADVLASHRMFALAMRKPGSQRETPAPIAGLGVVRACVGRKDGTSHLILEGIARVELLRTVSYRPYRTCRLRPLMESPSADRETLDALAVKARELALQRLEKDFPLTPPFLDHFAEPGGSDKQGALAAESLRHFIQRVASLNDPGQLADTISSALLARHADRQAILEITAPDERLMKLIQFLLAEIRLQRKGQTP